MVSYWRILFLVCEEQLSTRSYRGKAWWNHYGTASISYFFLRCELLVSKWWSGGDFCLTCLTQPHMWCNPPYHTQLCFPNIYCFSPNWGWNVTRLKVDFSSPAIHHYPKKQSVKLQDLRGWVYWNGRWYRRVYKLQLQHECTFCKLTLKHSQNHLHIWLIKESKRFPIVPIWSKFIITSHIGYISF